MFASDRHKNSRFTYYVRNIARALVPRMLHMRRGRRLLESAPPELLQQLRWRVDYYFRVPGAFEVGPAADNLPLGRVNDRRNYFFDLAEYLRCFDARARLHYRFGDETTPPAVPTIVKARQVGLGDTNSVLFKLNKVRHFVFVNDRLGFAAKQNSAVWRGNVTRVHRQKLLERWFDSRVCDVGRTDERPEGAPWRKPYLGIDEQLAHKFVIAIEGNDVATNLKWVLSSNSLCLMPRPTKETWFMEGRLEPGVHYVELRADYEDLEEQIARWSRDTAGAEAILRNAHAWVEPFRDPELEDLASLLVLKRYFEASGQA